MDGYQAYSCAQPSLMNEYAVQERMPFKRPRARTLSIFQVTAQFSLMLRLVAIAKTVTTDTFGCEHLRSLVNDLQTVFQTRMEHDCLCSRKRY